MLLKRVLLLLLVLLSRRSACRTACVLDIRDQRETTGSHRDRRDTKRREPIQPTGLHGRRERERERERESAQD